MRVIAHDRNRFVVRLSDDDGPPKESDWIRVVWTDGDVLAADPATYLGSATAMGGPDEWTLGPHPDPEANARALELATLVPSSDTNEASGCDEARGLEQARREDPDQEARLAASQADSDPAIDAPGVNGTMSDNWEYYQNHPMAYRRDPATREVQVYMDDLKPRFWQHMDDTVHGSAWNMLDRKIRETGDASPTTLEQLRAWGTVD